MPKDTSGNMLDEIIKDFREYALQAKRTHGEGFYIERLESFLRHALMEYGDAREEENEKLWTLGSKLSEHDEKIRAEAYEKGFQAGHAKERWLKDEVEKDARNAALDDAIKAVEKKSNEYWQKYEEEMEKSDTGISDDFAAAIAVAKEIISALQSLKHLQ